VAELTEDGAPMPGHIASLKRCQRPFRASGNFRIGMDGQFLEQGAKIHASQYIISDYKLLRCNAGTTRLGAVEK
jgi:hypothetical protein